jgi:hypothetical protein
MEAAMGNYWRTAFFILLAVSVGGGTFLIYGLIDQSISLNYITEGYADCEAHRDFLSGLLEKRISKEEIIHADIKVEHGANGYSYKISDKEIYFQYDPHGKYVGSSLGGSTTPKFKPN